MAFQNYDEYMKTFGNALAGASAPEQPSMAGGAFGGAGPEVPPQQPPMQAPMQAPAQAPMQSQAPPAPAGAFGPAPESAAGPVAAAPSGPAGPAFSAPPEGGAEGGLNMKQVYDESGEEEREELATSLEPQVPGGDLVKAAKAAEEIDPTLAEKWGVGEWDRHEAAAFLMEFGLRMMASSGSGEGNFFSDVGQSALGATEARRAFRKDKIAEQDATSDREWKAKERAREEAGWEGEDREKVRARKRLAAEEMRKGQTHELNKQIAEKQLNTGTWTTTIDDEGYVVFTDPNTKETWATGIKASNRDANGKASAFAEQLDVWQEAAAGLNDMEWEDMTKAQKSAVRQAFFEYQKTGVNSKAARQKAAMDLFNAMPDRVKGSDPEGALENAKAMVDKMMGPADEEGGKIPLFKKGPPANATDEEIAAFYADPANQ